MVKDMIETMAHTKGFKVTEQRSRSAYARYEQGTTMPTIEKLEQLLQAIAPDQNIVWRIAA